MKSTANANAEVSAKANAKTKAKVKGKAKGRANSNSAKSRATTLSTVGGENGPLFFFRPNEAYGEFCQWYPAIFTVTKSKMSDLVGHPIDDSDPEGWNTIYFSCAEQFMMYCKAGRFRDKRTQELVLATRDPKEQKRLGSLTSKFRAASWDEIKSAVVTAGNMAKFSQNPHLKDILMGTDERLLAEASSNDRVWGIGYTAQTAMQQREQWGENRLGQALMEVRARLREEGRTMCDEEVPSV